MGEKQSKWGLGGPRAAGVAALCSPAWGLQGQSGQEPECLLSQ